MAIKIVANRLKVAVSKLKVGNSVNVDGITRFKVLHIPTRRTEFVNLDQNNKEVSEQQLKSVLEQRLSKNFKGKLEAKLADQVSQSPQALSSIVIWVNTPGPAPKISRDGDKIAKKTQVEPFEEPSTVVPESVKQAEIEAYKKFHKSASEQVKKFIELSGGVVKYQSERAPVLVATVTNSLVTVLEKRNDVQSIWLEKTYQLSMNTAAPAIDAPTVWNRTTSTGVPVIGSGVRVAVVENNAIYFEHEDLRDGTYCTNTAASPSGYHATGVAGVIASTNTSFKGVAPDAVLLSGNAVNLTDAAIMQCTGWALNLGTNVINWSFGSNTSGYLSNLDNFGDYVVRNNHVTLTVSAGNIGPNGCTDAGGAYVLSPGLGWNSITVGSYDEVGGTPDNSDDVMSNSSCHGDPAGDREKPEVVAPGEQITTTNNNSTTGLGVYSGTSFSSPMAAGCAALMMQRKPILLNWPESIKATLMASAVVNLEESTRLSEKDGAGGIECDSADDVLTQGSNAGVETRNTILQSSEPVDVDYFFRVTAGQTVRVVIAWDSTTAPASAPTTGLLNTDFDLSIYSHSESFVTESNSFNNTYEIVEFTAAETGIYRARIHAPSIDNTSEQLGFAVWRGTRER
jgi:hypothetical protein